VRSYIIPTGLERLVCEPIEERKGGAVHSVIMQLMDGTPEGKMVVQFEIIDLFLHGMVNFKLYPEEASSVSQTDSLASPKIYS
jgi:hypothetical protein